MIKALVTAALITLAIPQEAASCPGKKGEASAAEGCGGCTKCAGAESDPRDAEAAKKGEPAKVVGTMSCPACEGKAKGPCSPTLRDAKGKTYTLTHNGTTHQIHKAAFGGGTVEVEGKMMRDNGTAILSPQSFRVITASAAAKPGDDKKSAGGSCQH